MNKIAKRLLAAALCLAMAVALLPVVGIAAETTPAPEGIVLFEENDFTNALKGTGGQYAADGYGAPQGQTTRMSVINEEDGNKILKLATNGQSYIFLTLNNLNIVSTGNTVLCMEYRVSAPTVQYQMQIQSNTSGVVITNDANKSDVGTFGIGNTATADYEVHRQYWTIGAGTLSSVYLRFGARAYSGASEQPVKYDYVKLYLVDYSDAQLKSELESADGYAKLSADADLGGSLTLGDNATLDLNGHTLSTTVVNGGANSVIIDSSADKSGKLVTEDLLLDNKSNPQLPLKAASGYVFAEPKLNDETANRAILSGMSADGFTLDFRPGFGTAVRENILSQGNTGVKMTAQLSWTDIYGYEGAVEGGLDGTKIFDNMYKTDTARGRLQITGAEKYRDISLTITLKSCGVEITFDPVTFNNTYVTTHFAADFETGSISNTESNFNVGKMVSFGGSTIIENDGDKVLNATGAHRITFGQSITVAAGSMLVIEYDLYADAYDYYAIQGGSQSSNLIATNGYPTSGTIGSFFSTTSQAENKNLCHSESVHVRMTVDLGDGMWYLYRNGIEYQHGSNATLVASLNGGGTFLLRVQGQTHYFDNLLIYTVAN